MRVRGQIAPADDQAPDGIEEVSRDEHTGRGAVVYALTGTASVPRDVWGGDEGSDQHHHAGAELVLSVGSDRFQLEFDASASKVALNSRLTATGELVLVGDYEWGAFDLTDTRVDWLVARVVDLSDRDLLVDLQPCPADVG